MSWNSLLNNQWISRADLQDAVTTGHFTLKPAQSIPAGNNFVTRSEVETWTNAIVTSGVANQWPQKSWLITTTSTTTTSTTTANPFFIVNVHNNGTQININQVHGINSYVSPLSYPITPGQSRTDNNWPISDWGVSGGVLVIGTTSTLRNYHISVYVNSSLAHEENSNQQINNGSAYHFSFGYTPPAVSNSTIDIYLRDGLI